MNKNGLKLFVIGILVFTMSACTINLRNNDCECSCEKTNENTKKNEHNYIGKEFTRTYMVNLVSESNDYEYLYLTLRQFQSEEIETVRVKRNDFDNCQQDAYYEITFKVTNNDIEDNIKSIFENTEIIKTVKTNKTGLEQIQEDFDK